MCACYGLKESTGFDAAAFVHGKPGFVWPFTMSKKPVNSSPFILMKTATRLGAGA